MPTHIAESILSRQNPLEWQYKQGTGLCGSLNISAGKPQDTLTTHELPMPSDPLHVEGTRLMINKFPVGQSAEQQQILGKLSKIASTDAAVLISAPHGMGKELYARYVHQCSARGKAAFTPVNCGTLPAELLDEELFGHVSGAMTRAQPPSEGLVAAADGGTLFLDEIDALTLIAQLKLLRFLQEKEYRRPGETRIRRVNVRVIAATSINLLAALHNGRFCAELFNAFTCVYLRSMSVNTRQRQLVFVVR